LTGTLDFALLHPALIWSNPFQEPDRVNNFIYAAKIPCGLPLAAWVELGFSRPAVHIVLPVPLQPFHRQ
jgi:hypothetical protein